MKTPIPRLNEDFLWKLRTAKRGPMQEGELDVLEARGALCAALEKAIETFPNQLHGREPADAAEFTFLMPDSQEFNGVIGVTKWGRLNRRDALYLQMEFAAVGWKLVIEARRDFKPAESDLVGNMPALAQRELTRWYTALSLQPNLEIAGVIWVTYNEAPSASEESPEEPT